MSDRWERIGRLFEETLAVSAAERPALLDASSEPDDIKSEVRSLLAAHETSDDFLDRPATVDDEPDVAAVEPDLPRPLLESGASVGPYRINRVLGRGGMGVVYLAEDTRLHRLVALKSLAPELSAGERQRERLKREARAAAALAHPGIATIYALEELDDQLYIASEYLEGETLRAEVERAALPPERAVATALEIARALVAAHERGIVHRDLKPENVVRTTDGSLKILDFGLAQFQGDSRDLVSRTRLTDSGLVAGTPSYMAPEQLLGRATDFRADQFALGVVLYELCTGRHPFEGHSLSSVIAQILAAEPQPPRVPDEMPADVWRIVDRCLRKEPEERFPSTREIVKSLEDVAAAFQRATPSAAAVTVADAARRTAGAALRTPDALRTSHSARTSDPALRTSHSQIRTPLFWWQFHQSIAALAYWSMVWPAWKIRTDLGRAGFFFFFALLAAIVVASNLRLHLWFSSRVYPQELQARRAEVSPWIRVADSAFVVLLIVAGIALPETRAGWAALVISFGIGSALAFLFIEPATARAAFDSAD